jgi:hypothetical protein
MRTHEQYHTELALETHRRFNPKVRKSGGVPNHDDLIPTRPRRRTDSERLDAHLTAAGQEQQHHEGDPALHGSSLSRAQASAIPSVTTFPARAL